MTELKNDAKTTIVSLAILAFGFPGAVFADSDPSLLSIPLFGFPGGFEALFSDDSVAPAYAQLSGDHKQRIASLEAPKPAAQRKLSAYARRISVSPSHRVVATAYSSTIDQTDNDPCSTANGFNVCKHNTEDVIAANYLPFGTRVRLPDLYGERVFTVQDRMNARYGNGRIDLWMKTRASAKQFGVKATTLEIIDEKLAAAL